MTGPLLEAARDIRDRCGKVADGFESHVTHVYNPLEYAWPVHREYVETYGDGRGSRQAVLVGMNPGPWGMVQTGVPFSDPRIAWDWLDLDATYDPPGDADWLHPDRPVLGRDSHRTEKSGERVFTLAREAFGGYEAFFDRFWVHNYCPLAFFEEDGANRTPPRLWKADRQALFEACDPALEATVDALDPDVVVGIGKFGTERAREAVGGRDDVTVGGILHPSPANPPANQGWGEKALDGLRELGIES